MPQSCTSFPCPCCYHKTSEEAVISKASKSDMKDLPVEYPIPEKYPEVFKKTTFVARCADMRCDHCAKGYTHEPSDPPCSLSPTAESVMGLTADDLLEVAHKASYDQLALVLFHECRHQAESSKGIAKIREALHAARLAGADSVMVEKQTPIKHDGIQLEDYGTRCVQEGWNQAVAEMKAKREKLV